MVIYIIVLGYIYIDGQGPGKVPEKIQIFICHPKQIN